MPQGKRKLEQYLVTLMDEYDGRDLSLRIAAVKQQLDALSAHPANPGRPARSRPRAVLLAQITIPPMLAAVKSP